MRFWALPAVLATGPYLCEPEAPPRPYEPPTITYEDGLPAREAGPFASRATMRSWLGHFCPAGYSILDGDDRTATHTKGEAVAAPIGRAAFGTSSAVTTESHFISVVFRCSEAAPVDAGAPAVVSETETM